jgi:LEA14-like dessication related protein
MLNACSTIPTDFEQPSVSVISFSPARATGISPQFEIVLRITNPNRNPLEVQGVSYSIYLDSKKVMSGVAKDFPAIEPYGEADVKLNATANLLGGLEWVKGMVNETREYVEYEFKARLDVGMLRPRIEVSKKGRL